MMDSAVQRISNHPEAFVGPRFAGPLFLTLTMGVLATQTTTYFSTFGYESPRMFWLVVSCVFLVVSQWIVLINIIWDWGIKNYGDWKRFEQVTQGSIALPVTAWLAVFTSQLFFASRCYTLYGRSKLLFGALLFGMTMTFATFTARGIVVAIRPEEAYLLNMMSNAGLVVNVATDVAITGLTLWKIGRGRTTYSARAQHGLERLRTIVVEAAVPPTVSVILSVSTCSLTDITMVSRFFANTTPMLYVLSLLFTLNSRVAVSQKFNAPSYSYDEELSANFQFANMQASDHKNGPLDTETTTVGLETPREGAYPHHL